MATYNGEKYLAEQLKSILSQIGADDEVVISDDNSSDGTMSVIASFNDPRIKVHVNKKCKDEQKTNKIVKNFENALRHAKGDYIFLSDQDDIWKEGRISEVLPLLKVKDLVVSDCQIVDANGVEVSNSLFCQLNSNRGFFKNLYRNTYVGCTMAFTRSLLEYVLPFPKNIPMHDSWIGMNADIAGFDVLFLDKPLIEYRRHNNNISSSSEKSRRPMLRRLKDRFILIFYLLRKNGRQILSNFLNPNQRCKCGVEV